MTDIQPLLLPTGTLALVWGAAWIDFRTFRIPNALVLLGAAFGLLVQGWDSGLDGLGQGLAGMGLGLALLLPVYLIGHMGAGDVKLMGAVGALLGAEQLLHALLYSVAAAGVVAAVYVLSAWWSGGVAPPWQRYVGMLGCLWATGRMSYVAPAPGEAMARRIPLAVPVAVGTTVTLLWPL
jgi:prepilin peptidase CpaA